tara:strand:- start:677 stop:1246 length:570 start_codon:yes stop_codon:yes gene_type:complete
MEERAKIILNFWFNIASPQEKFGRNNEFDQKIKNLFFDDYQKAIKDKYNHWQDSPEECLALIILFDQFSRNLFRNSPKAFAADDKARIIARKAIDKNFHKILSKDKILFIFLPLMHSEQLNDQNYCIELIQKHLKDNPQYKEINKFAKIHLDIVKKFGRFPYRNKVLKRNNTIEEEKYLKTTHYDFFNI